MEDTEKMKLILGLLLVIGLICLFTNCSQHSSRAGDERTDPAHSAQTSANDPEWDIKITKTDGQKGQFSTTCSKDGHCWYWNHSSVWAHDQGGLIRLHLPIAENEQVLNGFVLSRRVGWLVTSLGLHQTSDAGSSWIRIPVPNLDSGRGQIQAVYFEDEQHGWVVGGEYRTLVSGERVPNNAVSDDRKAVLEAAAKNTVDGGVTWDTTGIGKSIGRFNRVIFSGRTGLLSGDAGLKTTRDGGKSWADALSAFFSRDTGEKPEVKSTFLLDERRGWVSLSGGKLLTTEDGAASWKEIADSADHSFDQIVFVNEFVGLALQVHLGIGNLYKTNDAGKTWAPLNLNSSFSGLALGPAKNAIIVVGDDGIYSFTLKSG
jgi:photosystem II stability/assembly factor-like uncharacterized protein